MGVLITNRDLMERDLADRPSPILSDGTALRSLFNIEKREVAMRVLNDPELHRMELKYVFARSWVIVGHVSEIPDAGDYVKRAIGEDAVIVARGRDGEVNIMLNACSHRGMEICWADQGNQASFKCPYHGWVFDHAGNLMGAPFEKEMYGDWDKSQYGLRTAKVAVRKGVIFGAFNPICDLDDWLGEFGWYFDIMYGSVEMEAISSSGAKQLNYSNWKAVAEQNCGDGYHNITLHHSQSELGLFNPPPTDITGWGLDCYDTSSVEGHGLRIVEIDHNVFHLAEPEPFPVGWFCAGSMFPGHPVSLTAGRGGGSVMGSEKKVDSVAYSSTIGGIVPSGPNAYAMWSVPLVDKRLPEDIRVAMRRASIGAIIGADDMEAWPSMTKVAQGVIGAEQPIRYNAILGANNPAEFPGPALVHRGMSKDDNQWHFWMRWYDMMTTDIA